MSLDGSISLNDQISREAAEWLVEFRTGDIDGAGRREFDVWLRASPEHIRAFIEMAVLWHEGGAIDPRRQLEIAAIGDGATVLPLPIDRAAPRAAAHPAEGNPRSGRARAVGWALAASLLVAAFAVALIARSGLLGGPTYTAALRAPRSIVLPDGSRVLLDSKSRLQVSFTAARRRVALLQGQALFYVVNDPHRPFLVHTGDTVVRDVGTVFNVNRLGGGTVVTVVEGRAAVGAAQPIYLSAGEQLDVRAGPFSPRPIHVDVSSEIAWTQGEVVLESATLTEAAQVFSRYATRRLVADDLGKSPLRVSGVFSTDPDFLIRYLRGRPDILVTETDSEVHIVRNRSHNEL
jgi:transmembrane sensor